MKNNMISIIVLTYYPNYEKLFKTLYSIIIQKECSFEVILSDDGTKDLDVIKIENWFKEKSFSNYTILANEENVGTVKNSITALKNAKGNYVKLISPGDYLYNEYTLSNLLKFMIKNDAELVLGKAVYYSIDSKNNISIKKKSSPKNYTPYIKKDINKIKKAYFVYQDAISGSAIAGDKEIFLKYFSEIEDKVKYAEDGSIFLMIEDGVKIDFYNDWLIWYECDTGVSTNKNSKFYNQVGLDIKNSFQMLVERNEKKYKKLFDLQYEKVGLKNICFKLKKKIWNKFYKFCNKFKKYNISIEYLKNIINEK